jgi:predicted dehydrogenase
LLDGGVHFVAALRLLLGESEAITRVSAFTTKLQEHLPPIDTVTAVAQTKSGVCGTISISFGTTFGEDQYSIAFEKGTVLVSRDEVKVKTSQDVKTEAKTSNDVKVEVASWAAELEGGKPEARQSPEEALADLAILEAMLESGKKNGAPIDI